MSIINEVLEAYKNNVFTQKHLASLKEIEYVELASLFDIEDMDARNYLIKAYLTTYNDEVIDSAQQINNNVFSEMVRVWQEELLRETPESIISGMIGYSFLTTDIVSKIRSNMKGECVSDFESQVYNIFEFLKNKIDDGDFIYTLFGSNKKIFPKEKDSVILHKMKPDTKNICNELIEKVIYICDIWQYYIAKSKGDDVSFLVEKIQSKNKNIFAKTILPPSVYNKMEFLLVEINEESDFIDILNLSDRPQQAVFEDTKSEKDSLRDGGKHLIDSFKKIKSKNNSVNRGAESQTNKKRNVLKSSSTKESGNGKKIMATVLIMLSLSAFSGILLHKTSEKKEEPISKTILSGISANVTLNDVEEKEIKEKEEN
jgi:hypothetical protein